MSKGSTPRPLSTSRREFERLWGETFGVDRAFRELEDKVRLRDDPATWEANRLYDSPSRGPEPRTDVVFGKRRGEPTE